MDINYIPNYYNNKSVNLVNRVYEKENILLDLTPEQQEIIGAILGINNRMVIRSREDAMAAYFSIKHEVMVPSRDELNKVFTWMKPSFAPSAGSIVEAIEMAHYNSLVNFFCNKSFDKWVDVVSSDIRNCGRQAEYSVDLTDYISSMNNRGSIRFDIDYKFYSFINDPNDPSRKGIITEYHNHFNLENPVDDFSFIVKNGIIVNSKSVQMQRKSFSIDSLLSSTVNRIGLALISVSKIDLTEGDILRLPHIICIV